MECVEEDEMSDRIEILRRELKDLRSQIATLEVSLEYKPDYGLGGGSPAVTRWEMDRAMLEQLRERAERLEEARLEMMQGTYGICTDCGKPIHPDRLAILPDTQMCVRCARAGTRGELMSQSVPEKIAA
jgi:RNA polymerase-binding transcription factor DksA